MQVGLLIGKFSGLGSAGWALTFGPLIVLGVAFAIGLLLVSVVLLTLSIEIITHKQKELPKIDRFEASKS